MKTLGESEGREESALIFFRCRLLLRFNPLGLSAHFRLRWNTVCLRHFENTQVSWKVCQRTQPMTVCSWLSEPVKRRLPLPPPPLHPSPLPRVPQDMPCIVSRLETKHYFLTLSQGIVQELNKNHDIIKMTTTSLLQCHQLACTAADGASLHSGTLVEGRYTHRECVNIHLRLLAFVLQEGALYLPSSRAKDIWDCLVVNPSACELDREVQFCLLSWRAVKWNPAISNSQGFREIVRDSGGWEIARLASNFWSNSLIPKINKYRQLVAFCIRSGKSSQSDFAFVTVNTSIHFSAFSTSCHEVPWLHFLTDFDQCFFGT